MAIGRTNHVDKGLSNSYSSETPLSRRVSFLSPLPQE